MKQAIQDNGNLIRFALCPIDHELALCAVKANGMTWWNLDDHHRYTLDIFLTAYKNNPNAILLPMKQESVKIEIIAARLVNMFRTQIDRTNTISTSCYICNASRLSDDVKSQHARNVKHRMCKPCRDLLYQCYNPPCIYCSKPLALSEGNCSKITRVNRNIQDICNDYDRRRPSSQLDQLRRFIAA